MVIGVYNQLQNERYLGSITILSFGEPGSLGIGVVSSQFSHVYVRPFIVGPPM